MQLCAFDGGSGRSIGLVDGELVHRLSDDLVGAGDMLGLVERWPEIQSGLSADTGETHKLEDVRLLAPFATLRRNIFCVGLNYHAHVDEFVASGYGDAEVEAPSEPIVFTKAYTSICGPGDPVIMARDYTTEVDYEAELAVIIGTGGRRITRESALDHVWGYTAVNDVTARDRQAKHKQWFLGKSMDTFCPMGPVVALSDGFDLDSTIVECRVGGELRQKASIKSLIFDIPTLIATLSMNIELLPGDVIATGTPVGVGIGFNPPRFLNDGDVVDVSISGIGTLTNTFVEERM